MPAWSPTAVKIFSASWTLARASECFPCTRATEAWIWRPFASRRRASSVLARWMIWVASACWRRKSERAPAASASVRSRRGSVERGRQLAQGGQGRQGILGLAGEDLGARQAQPVLGIVGEEGPQGLVDLHRLGPVLAGLLVQALHQEAVLAGEGAVERERPRGLLLGLGVVAEAAPGHRQAGVGERERGLRRGGFQQLVAGGQRVQRAQARQPLGVVAGRFVAGRERSAGEDRLLVRHVAAAEVLAQLLPKVRDQLEELGLGPRAGRHRQGLSGRGVLQAQIDAHLAARLIAQVEEGADQHHVAAEDG